MPIGEARSIHIWLRVSTDKQEFKSQLRAIYNFLSNNGVERTDKRIKEWRQKTKGDSDKTAQNWERLVSMLQENDYIVAYDATRIGRPMEAKQSFYILEQIAKIYRMGAVLKLVEAPSGLDLEQLPDFAKTIVAAVFSAAAGIDLALHRARTKHGVHEAIERRGTWGRTAKVINPADVKTRLSAGESKSSVMKSYDIQSRTTFLRLLRKHGLEEFIHEVPISNSNSR